MPPTTPIAFERLYRDEAKFLMDLYSQEKKLKWYCYSNGHIYEYDETLKQWFRI